MSTPRPKPDDRTKAHAAEAAERNAKRPARPEIAAGLKTEKGQTLRTIHAPHSDQRGWQEMMLDAFGTTSFDFVSKELGRLDAAHRNAGEAYSDPQDLNAALAAIAGAKPENELEAMLVAQMTATHALAMKQIGHARRAEHLAQQDSHGSLATKLLRTFTMQAEALVKLRRGGEQTVRVEHVHVHSGGQAIVGQVTGTGREDGRGRQADGTIDARALAFAPGAAVLGEDAGRDAVPEAGCKGQEALPDARRSARKRRASR